MVQSDWGLHDVKARVGAADLMKRSVSVKRSEAEAVRLRRHAKEKQPPESTPNYMKSTSRSDARIKSSSVGTPYCSNLSGNGSKSSKPVASSSGEKAAKTLARTSSLKLFKISSKNSGFKIARTSVKKLPPVALCENLDLDAMKATCSSTLKHSKFPTHLALNPGGTEVEGTSAINVCSYNYCSLKDHHHDPSPPFKCFLSARRLTVKAQGGITLGYLSQRRGRPYGSGPNFAEKIVAADLVENPSSFYQAEGHRDFFVEILCKNVEETGMTGEEEQVQEMLSAAPDTLDQNVQEKKKLLDVNSDTSDVEQETGYGSVSYLDYYHEYSPVAVTEMADEVSQESSHEEGLNSESTCSHDYLWGFCKEASAHAEVAMEKPVPEYNNGENQTLFGCCEVADYQIIAEEGISSNDQNCKYLEDDGANTETDYQVPGSDGMEISGEECQKHGTEDFGTTSLGDPQKESGPTQAGCTAANKVETEDTSIAGTGDQNNSTEDFIASISVDPEASDFMAALLQTTEVNCGMADEIEAEDGTSAETGDHDKDLITLITATPENESDSVATLLWPTERKCNSPNKFKAEDAAKPDIENCGLALYITNCKTSINNGEESKPFNPRGPNFLPLEPDPEAEKVDLRHQELDERKNTKEYLVDYVLRQAVTKLVPAHKRKVSLLVEAFEKVMPVTKSELHSTPSPAFDLARPIQACQ